MAIEGLEGRSRARLHVVSVEDLAIQHGRRSVLALHHVVSGLRPDLTEYGAVTPDDAGPLWASASDSVERALDARHMGYGIPPYYA